MKAYKIRIELETFDDNGISISLSPVLDFFVSTPDRVDGTIHDLRRMLL